MTAEKREPCEYHIQFVEDIATIKETLTNLDKTLTNHWGEIEAAIKEYHELDKKVNEHTLLLAAIAKEKLNTIKASQWRIALICSISCSLPAWITVLILLFRTFGGVR